MQVAALIGLDVNKSVEDTSTGLDPGRAFLKNSPFL
jgi:hypothetical protein